MGGCDDSESVFVILKSVTRVGCFIFLFGIFYFLDLGDLLG